MASKRDQLGLWLIGACGSVATTAIVGLEAIRRGFASPTGLLGHLPPFDRLGLAPLRKWVVGGHEIRSASVLESALELHRESGAFTPEMIHRCSDWLKRTSREIRDGAVAHCGRPVERMVDRRTVHRKETANQIVNRLAGDIASFRRRRRLRHVVVVNVASTEPPFELGRVHQSWTALRRTLSKRGRSPLPASSLYALAAIETGASYINFTPSLGIDAPALRERAAERGVAYMGSDGKTGETLMKSVLAPMLAARNLEVLSWVGHNIFGNRDGVVLDDPANKATKVRSKDRLIREILGYQPKTLVSIEYIPALDDWKTAWDHVHFRGFLGTKMTLQFIWQGCDSLLAAPLVIELARFAEQAARAGKSGALTHLSSFFKSPMDTREHAFARQFEALLEYTRRRARP